MSKSNLVRLGAGIVIALSLGGCYYPWWHHHGGYGQPHYYWH